MGLADPPARAQGGLTGPAGEIALGDTVGSSIGSTIDNIVGTWRLVMTRAHDDAGQPMHAPYGPKPMGVVVFSADGRMIAVLCDARPRLPDDEPDREYSSYCGTYRCDGATLVTRVDAASDPSRLGGDQIRRIRFDGDRLVLMPPPRPWRGVMQHREMFFERIG
jgi:Lipocalin-like domain